MGKKTEDCKWLKLVNLKHTVFCQAYFQYCHYYHKTVKKYFRQTVGFVHYCQSSHLRGGGGPPPLKVSREIVPQLGEPVMCGDRVLLRAVLTVYCIAAPIIPWLLLAMVGAVVVFIIF